MINVHISVEPYRSLWAHVTHIIIQFHVLETWQRCSLQLDVLTDGEHLLVLEDASQYVPLKYEISSGYFSGKNYAAAFCGLCDPLQLKHVSSAGW